MLKTILHWVKAIIKILLLIVFSPLILLYFWLKISVYRFVVKHELRKYKLSKNQIKCLMSDMMKLSDGMRFLKSQ
jgi:hypothetical protein